MNRVQRAAENHKNGFNCSQAVACAFCDEVGIDEKTMFALTEGFGAGMGDMRGVCGALSGAAVILSMKKSGGDPDNPTTKAGTYKAIRELTSRFREKNGSQICSELKGAGNGGVPLRSCRGCVEDAAEILCDILNRES